MKKCNRYECGRVPITMYDEYIHDHLHPDDTGNCTVCANCQLSKSVKKALKRKHRHDLALFWGIAFIIIQVVFVSLTASLQDNFQEISLKYSLFWIWIPLSIILTIAVIKNMNVIHTYESYRPAETWYEAKTTYDDKVVFEEHHQNESYGTDIDWLGVIFAIFLFFTIVIWIVPYVIIIAVIRYPLLYRHCPRIVIDVYKMAKKQVPIYNITQTFDDKKRYLQHSQNFPKFIKERHRIFEKYSMLGHDEVQHHLQALNCPFWIVSIDNQLYKVIAYQKTDEKNGILNIEKPIYLLRKNKDCQFVGRAIVNGYLTPEEDISDLNTWAKDTLNSNDYDTFLHYVPYL